MVCGMRWSKAKSSRAPDQQTYLVNQVYFIAGAYSFKIIFKETAADYISQADSTYKEQAPPQTIPAKIKRYKK